MPDLAAFADVVRGATVAGVTVFVLVGGLFITGLVLLFRRRGDRRVVPAGGQDLPGLTLRAGSALLRADDELRAADDDLGFAVAQFGPDRARAYAEALAEARGKVAEAFRLQQLLNDHIPDTDRQRREWTLQVIALSEQAQQSLDRERAAFTALRSREASAAGAAQSLQRDIAAARERTASTSTVLADLTERYAAATLAAVMDAPARATALLTEAAELVDTAISGISDTGVNAVTADLQTAAQRVHTAASLLDTVDRRNEQLASATAAVAALRERTRLDLEEARRERDAAPDPETGGRILTAIATVEAAIGSDRDTRDPAADLDRIGDAVAELDLALASARNQADRLRHARAAYDGTLVSARSQIEVAQAVVRRSDVTARTRLAEAERQLAIAEAATDPVEALDAVRRAVRHAQDADALARYRG